VQRFYFDHNATTPLSAEVMEAFVPCLAEVCGNASSIHHYGQIAKQRLETARRSIAALIHAAPREIVFTSGGTESDNLALLGSLRPCEGKHIITTAIEHPAVLNTCAQLEREGAAVTYLRVGACGVVDPGDIRAALRPDTALISVMHVNNELGTVQPLAEISAIAREAGVLFHSDGVQAVGKLRVDVKSLGVDLYAASGHKLYAPKGIGILYVRKGTRLRPLLHGGKHERERRPGTENVPAAFAFGVAASSAMHAVDAEPAPLAALRDRLESAICERVPNAWVNGDRTRRVGNTSNIRFDFIEGEPMVIALDLQGFAVSSGAACSSGAVEPSHVLTAIGLSRAQARSSIRFSLGRQNTEEQVDALVEAIVVAVAHLRRISADAPVHA
jgi:cysteine desulfurase